MSANFAELGRRGCELATPGIRSDTSSLSIHASLLFVYRRHGFVSALPDEIAGKLANRRPLGRSNSCACARTPCMSICQSAALQNIRSTLSRRALASWSPDTHTNPVVLAHLALATRSISIDESTANIRNDGVTGKSLSALRTDPVPVARSTIVIAFSIAAALTNS